MLIHVCNSQVIKLFTTNIEHNVRYDRSMLNKSLVSFVNYLSHYTGSALVRRENSELKILTPNSFSALSDHPVCLSLFDYYLSPPLNRANIFAIVVEPVFDVFKKKNCSWGLQDPSWGISALT